MPRARRRARSRCSATGPSSTGPSPGDVYDRAVTAILGLNVYHGDAAAALVVDGTLVAAVEEERFSRLKHVAGFPAQAAAWCLRDAGLTAADLDHVAVGRDPRANLGAKVQQTLRRLRNPAYVAARLSNMAKIRNVRDDVAAALGVEKDALRAQFHNVEHHQAHAASAFFVSPFEEAAILTLDGFGDFASALLGVGRGDRFEILDRVVFPHSLGIFYTAITQWLGFPKYGDEGKVMGLAPYGDPNVHRGQMRDLVRLDGLFELNLDYFTHHAHGVDMTWAEGSPTIGRVFSQRLEDTFGPAPAPGGELAKHHRGVAGAVEVELRGDHRH